MNKITKGDARAFYSKMKREERMKMMANILLLLPMIGILFWLAGCSTPSDRTFEYRYTPTTPQQEWRDIYADVTIPHPPRNYGYEPNE